MIDIEKLNALQQKLSDTEAQKKLTISNKFLELYHKIGDLYQKLDNNGHNLTRRFTYPLETEVYHTFSYEKLPLELVAFMYKSPSGELEYYVYPNLRGVYQSLYDIKFHNDFSYLTADSLADRMTYGNNINSTRNIGFPEDIYEEITDKADDIYEKFEIFVENTLEQIYENKIRYAISELDDLEME